jgi:hypothetical protein
MNDGPEWFAPKRYGYGASLPISWQGWVLTLAFVGIIMLAGVLLKSRPWQLIAVAIPVSVTFMVICAKTTRGGWRWRWGEED